LLGDALLVLGVVVAVRLAWMFAIPHLVAVVGPPRRSLLRCGPTTRADYAGLMPEERASRRELETIAVSGASFSPRSGPNSVAVSNAARSDPPPPVIQRQLDHEESGLHSLHGL
jgi:hypothetical protein